MNTAIVVEDLSKSFVLGARPRETMLRGQLSNAFGALFRRSEQSSTPSHRETTAK